MNENFYSKTEIKNLNSFKAVEYALKYEIKRQTELWRDSKVPKIEMTRGWDALKGVTVEQRSKEKTKDYRYFKEPDLPVFFTKSKGFPFDIKELNKSLPELPAQRRKRWQKKYGFSENEIRILTISSAQSCFIENVIKRMEDWITSREGMDASESEIWQRNKKKIIKLIVNWFINYYLVFSQELNKKELSISSKDFTEFIILIYGNKLSNILGRKILKKMFQTEQDANSLLVEFDSQEFIESDKTEIIIQDIIKNNPEIVAKIQKGHPHAIQFLIGQTIKKTKGQVSPDLIKKLLTKFLK